MTDSRTGQPEWSPSEQTIPLVPDSGYDQPNLPPLPEETLVDPMGPTDPWASGPGLGEGAPPHAVPRPAQRPAPSPTEQAAPPAPAPMAFGSPADYSRASAPTWPQPSPQAWPHPPAQAYPQPVAPATAPPQATYAQPAYAEPDGPASTLQPQTFQTYATSGYAGQAWPGAVDPVNYDYGYAGMPTSAHPNAVVSLVLGILGLVFFPLLSPVAWYLAARGRRQMRYEPGRWAPSAMLTAGLVTGIIGTVFLALIAVFVLFILAMLMGGG